MSVAVLCGTCGQAQSVPTHVGQFICLKCHQVNNLQGSASGPGYGPPAGPPSSPASSPGYGPPAGPPSSPAGYPAAAAAPASASSAASSALPPAGTYSSSPAPMAMSDGMGIIEDLMRHPGLHIMQEKSCCPCYCRGECIDCEPPGDVQISDIREIKTNIMFAGESHNWLCHLCCGNSRPTTLELKTRGQKPMGVVYEKPARWDSGCCCCQPEILMFDASTRVQFARASVPCTCPFYWCAGPKVRIDFRDGKTPSLVGQGPECTQGGSDGEFPFMQGVTPRGGVKPMHTGTSDCGHDWHEYQVEFTSDMSPHERAALLGASFLIEYTFWEPQRAGPCCCWLCVCACLALK